jgi:hypothetical protein
MCPQEYKGEIPEAALNAKYVLVSWLAVRNGETSVGADQEEWAQSKNSEAWVRSSYDALSRCAFEDLKVPQW